MNGGVTAAAAAAKSVLHKPLHELTEDDISQLTREDCRRFLKEKGMRRPSWNKSQAIQQVICLKSLLEPSPPNAGAKPLFRPPLPPPLPLNSATTNNTVTVNSSSFSSVKELSPAEAEESVTALEDRFPEGPSSVGVSREGECRADDIECSRDRCEDTSKSQFDQMTIFYSGRVNVYEGVPVDKQARTIMHLAASPIQFSQDERSGENLANLNSRCQLPSKSVKLNLATPDAPISQSMLPGKISDHVYYRAEGNNLQEQDVESQTNRQVSLQRYFDKRKDRGKSKMKRKIGTSSTGLEMYLNHQMKVPLPIISTHNSEAKTSAASQLGPPQTSHETRETQLKSPGLSVDLNDKA
ncbi:hypothetical protein RND81_14G032600 [Saponaria officinalis]|uniref:Protein TIFY n=1 Tax=Saponaria officinalis TaxID=3572 RepID=A0AAW1GLB1_SAPOF